MKSQLLLLLTTCKNYLLIVFFSLFTISLFAQDKGLELSIKKQSQEPNTKTEHFYLLELKNNSSSTLTVNLVAKNIECNEPKKTSQAELNFDFLLTNQSKIINNLNLNAYQAKEFYLKISRPINTKLETWNCSEIIAKSINDLTTSNIISINTFIPDPRNFN